MGRSTEYTDEVVEIGKDYIQNYETYGDAIPSVVGLCKAIKRSRSTIYKWADEQGGEFSDMLREINELQHQVVINKGITGEFNSTIAKLVLSKHGYSDTQKVESNITLRDATEMSDEELASIASTSSK